MDSFEIHNYHRVGPGGSILDTSTSSEAPTASRSLLSALLHVPPSPVDGAAPGTVQDIYRGAGEADAAAQSGSTQPEDPSAAEREALWNSLVSELLARGSGGSSAPVPSPSLPSAQVMAWAQGVLAVPQGATVRVQLGGEGEVLSVQRLGFDDMPELLPARASGWARRGEHHTSTPAVARSHTVPGGRHSQEQQDTYATPAHSCLPAVDTSKDRSKCGSEKCDMSAVTVPTGVAVTGATLPHAALQGRTDSQGTAAVGQGPAEQAQAGSSVFEEAASMPLSHVYEPEGEGEGEGGYEASAEEHEAVGESIVYEYEGGEEEHTHQGSVPREAEDRSGTSAPAPAPAPSSTLARAAALGMAFLMHGEYGGNERDWRARGGQDPQEDWQQGRGGIPTGLGIGIGSDSDDESGALPLPPSSPAHALALGYGGRLVSRLELYQHAVRLRDAAAARTREKAIEACKKRAEKAVEIGARWAARQAAQESRRAEAEAGKGAEEILARLTTLGKPVQAQEELLDSSLDTSLHVSGGWQHGRGAGAGAGSLMPEPPPGKARSHTAVVQGWGGEVASQSQSLSQAGRVVGVKASHSVALGAGAGVGAAVFKPSTPLFSTMLQQGLMKAPLSSLPLQGHSGGAGVHVLPVGLVPTVHAGASGGGSGGARRGKGKVAGHGLGQTAGNRSIADMLARGGWG